MPNKYKNIPQVTSDGVFDSKKEYERWCVLKLMERAGKISALQRQVEYELIPKQRYKGKTIRAAHYIADFVYQENGQTIVEDVKGTKTDLYKLKKKLMLWRYGIMIKET